MAARQKHKRKLKTVHALKQVAREVLHVGDRQFKKALSLKLRQKLGLAKHTVSKAKTTTP